MAAASSMAIERRMGMGMGIRRVMPGDSTFTQVEHESELYGANGRKVLLHDSCLRQLMDILEIYKRR